MSSSKKVAGKLFGGALLAGVIGLGASQANAGFMLDVRVAGSADPYKAIVANVGDQVNLNVYAVVSDGTDANSGTIWAHFGVVSTGPIGGDLSAAAVNDSFHGNGWQAGTAQDLNGDGFVDVGGKTTGSIDGWINARANAAPQPVLGKELLLATLTYTVKAIGTGDTLIQVSPRPRGASSPASWQENGTISNVTGTGNKAQVGTGVTISAQTVTPVDEATLGGTAKYDVKGNLIVKANPRGYISDVLDLPNASEGSVKVDIQGTGPSGNLYALLWLQGDAAKVQAEIAKLGAIASGQLFDELQTWFSRPTVGGSPFSAMVSLPQSKDATYYFNYKFTEDGVTLDKIAMVPEPASLTVLGLGAAALMMARRRKA